MTLEVLKRLVQYARDALSHKLLVVECRNADGNDRRHQLCLVSLRTKASMLQTNDAKAWIANDKQPGRRRIHSYVHGGRELRSLHVEPDRGVRSRGVRLHVIRTNDLVDNLAARSFSPGVSEDKGHSSYQVHSPGFCLVDQSRRYHPANDGRAGLSDHFMARGPCPVHAPRQRFQHVVWRALIGCRRLRPQPWSRLSRSAIPRWQVELTSCHSQRESVTFSNPVRRARHARHQRVVRGHVLLRQRVPVASRRYRNDARIASALLAAARTVERDFKSDIRVVVDELGLSEVLADNGVAVESLHMAIANVASMNKRIRALDAVAVASAWRVRDRIDAAAHSLCRWLRIQLAYSSEDVQILN